mgnify:CR=1 FL=1
MDDNILRYTLRVNRTLFQKFRYIADYEAVQPIVRLSSILSRE